MQIIKPIRKMKSPRARFTISPYVSGFTEIENGTTDILIGSSKKPDDLFRTDFMDGTEYIRLLVRAVPKVEFTRPQISAKYRVSEDEDEEERVMSFDIYGGDAIDMNGFVSEVTIVFHELSGESIGLNEEYVQFLRANPNIYKRSFKIQACDSEIENFVDESLEDSDVIHTKTRAHFFAGSYNAGAPPSAIQQYLFYMGTEYQANEYISIVSGADLLRLKRVEPADDVTLEALSTLEDDIVDRKVVLTFQDGTVYRSVSSEKTTTTSDVFQILFKREAQRDE
jgi:hypothetical protein